LLTKNNSLDGKAQLVHIFHFSGHDLDYNDRDMDDFQEKYIKASNEISPIVRKLQSDLQRPMVAAIDGGSGAGKSTLSSLLTEQLDAALIPMDDFYAADIPNMLWDSFSVQERFEHCFDWARLREDVIKPLLAGHFAHWYAFDFISGLRTDGTYGMEREPKTLEPAGFILIDGNFSAGPALAGLVDFAILVDVPVDVRHARTAAREDPAFLERWHQRWDPVEEYYYNQLKPKTDYDWIVSG
jgi:uridine kinase